jgi:HEPN domain-containing protein
MNVPEHISETRRWLRYAREELAAAEAMLSQPDLSPRLACFLAQQSAEKAIKAILIFLQIDFPPRHNLDFLRDLIPADRDLKQEHPSLAQLTQYVIEGRYPGEWPDPTHDHGVLAVENAQSLLRSVVRDLTQHGLIDD